MSGWNDLALRLRTPLAQTATTRLRRLGGSVARGIAARTRAGRDVNGQPFVACANGQPSRLPRSRALLSSLRSTAIPGGVAIGFAGAAQERKAAAIQCGTGNRPARVFFGLGAAQRSRIVAGLHGLLSGRPLC